MEANEWRIGNLISRQDLGTREPRIETILELRKDKVHTSGPLIVICDYDDIAPIPLNEEWVLKFGFESSVGFEDQTYDPNDEYANQFEYTLDSGISHREFVCRPSKGWIIKLGDYDDELEVKYVHEFQNLFFALKGKELTLK